MASLLRELRNQVEKANLKYFNNPEWFSLAMPDHGKENIWVTFAEVAAEHDDDSFDDQLQIIRKLYHKLLNDEQKKLFDPLLQAAGEIASKKAEKELEEKCAAEQSSTVQAYAEMVNPASPAQHFAKLAEAYIKENPIYYDTKTKIWWAWNDNEKKWSMYEDVDILRNFKDKYSIVEWIHPVIRMRIIDTLKVYAGTKPKEAPKTWIQFKTQVYDIETQKTMDATPEYFHTNPIPHKLGASEETLTIDRLFSEWVGQRAETLYEMFAYCLLRDYPLQRIFVLLGTGANGKGTYMSLLRRFIGEENVTSSEIDMLAAPEARFERAKLMNKLVCTVGETNVGILKSTSILKQLSGGDLIGAEIKNKNPFTFINFAKIVVCSNALPMTLDKTEGFYRRWLIVEYPNKFGEGEDPNSKITDTELENLCRRCVNTLARLLKEKKFSSDGSVEERTKRYEDYSNPLRRFIFENYKKKDDGYTRKNEFNESFLHFLHTHGYRTMTEYEINKALRSMGHEIKNKRLKEGEEDVVTKCIFGLSENVTNVTDNPNSIQSENSVTSVTKTENQAKLGNILEVGNTKTGKTTPYNPSVTDVTEVTDILKLVSYIGGELENAVTLVTSVTKDSPQCNSSSQDSTLQSTKDSQESTLSCTKFTPSFIASELKEMQDTYKMDAIDEGDVRVHFEHFGTVEETDRALERALNEGLIMRVKGGLRAV